jgi:hypothetical protein
MAASVAMMIGVALVSPLAGSHAAMAQDVMNGWSSVVAFPFENTTGKGGEQLGAALSSAIRTNLAQQYAVFAFNPRSPSVERAISENRLSRQEVAPPFDTDKAIKVGKEMGADLVMVGSIDEITYDPNARTSSLTVTVQMIDTRTGTPVKTTAVTGRSREGAQTADEGALLAQAIEDVIGKITEGMGVTKTGAVKEPAKEVKAQEKQAQDRKAAPPEQNRSRNRHAAVVLAAFLALLVATNH